MAIDVTCRVEIDRPRAQVAAYMFDPSHDAEWTSGVIEARPRAPGPLRTGLRVERLVKFLGRRFGYEYQVTDADGETFAEMRVTQPFPMHIRYQLDADGPRTSASIRARGDATGFFRLAAPLMARMVRRNIDKDLALLKARLEA